MSGVAGTKGGERETGQGQMLGCPRGPEVQSRGWQDRGWTWSGNARPPPPRLAADNEPTRVWGPWSPSGPHCPGSEAGPGFVPQLGGEEVAVDAGGSRPPSLISQPAAFLPHRPVRRPPPTPQTTGVALRTSRGGASRHFELLRRAFAPVPRHWPC